MSSISAPLPPPADTLGEHIARTLKLALPVMFSRAGLLVLAAVDSAMTGHASSTELAYYALAAAPQIFTMLIGIGLLLGTVVLTAQADGAGRTQETGVVWRIALLHAAGYGLLMLGLMYTGEAFLLTIGQSADLAQGAGQVMIIFGWSLPAMLLYIATTLFLEGIGRPLPSLLIMIIANLLNAFLNWLLIYGNWGFPALGAEGAALATTIVRWFMFFAVAAYTWLYIDTLRYGVRGPLKDGWRLARTLRRIGYPMALTQGLESGSFTAMTLFAGLLGPVQVAAFQIIMTLIALVFMCALGFSTAASVRVGNAVGRRDPRGVRLAGWTAVGLVIIVLSACGLAFISVPEWLVSIYSNDPEVLAVAGSALAIAAIILIPDGVQAVLMGSLRGIADVWPASAMFFIAFWLVMIPLGYLLGVVWGGGAHGLVKAIFAGCITAAVLLAMRFQVVSARIHKAV
ncbi:MAG: MATE family efflux transporter [Candidatus Competibacteraceae bacterium]|nr:MATE family efflux transporter [Candidatus Competibacteraceae bacterium]